MKFALPAAFAVLSAMSSAAFAAEPSFPPPGPQPPAVTVTGAATTTVANDRMHATMRAEVEAPVATAGANEVNAKIAAALTRAKAVAGVETRTAGYLLVRRE